MPARPAVFFITGTDTGVGKSFVGAGILQAAREAGLSTAALKPIAAGCEETPDGLRNEDALLLQQQCTLDLSYEQINPVALPLPVAPHIAAVQAGRRLDIDRLVGFCRAVLLKRADVTVVEGAGGWRVPINHRHTLAELPRRLDIPVILVVGIRLGCINHALLSAEAIRADGLPLAGWVANHVDPHMPYAADNVATLESLIDAPCLARIPWQEDFHPGSSCAGFFDVRQLQQRAAGAAAN